MLLGSRMHWLKALQQLRSLSLPYIYIFDDGWASIARLPQLQTLHARCLYLTAPPALASLSIRDITVHRLLLSDQQHSVHDTQPAALSGRITQAAPALENLTVQHAGSAPSQVASSLASHTALRSLALTPSSPGYHRPAAPAWQGQPLASISSLTSLSIRDLSAQDVAAGMLGDVAACSGLRELQLGLTAGAWEGLGQECRVQLRALQGRRSLQKCSTEGMCAA
jgi:hypothetical protein